MDDPSIPVPSMICPQCRTEIAPSLLVCPSCKRLVHAGELKRLAAEAEQAVAVHDLSRALSLWRQALDLLPRGTRQHEIISNKVDDLSRRVGTGTPGAQPVGAPHPGSKWTKPAGVLGTIGLLSLLSKGKLLLLGLTKAGTFFSMLLSFGVYWTAWGWKFALGLVLSIYVHEMGHVFMLQRFGIKATAPMFIPGFGAMVRLKQYPANPREDARVGLAGPLWGLGAAIAAYLLYVGTGWTSLAGIARVGAWINLFNLLPVWQLDGGRGSRSLNRMQRWILAALIGALWHFVKEGLLAMLFLFAVVNAFTSAPEEPDHPGFVQFAFLLIILSLLCLIPIPGVAP